MSIHSKVQLRNTKISEAQYLVDAGLKTADDKTRYSALLAEIDTLQSDIDALNKIERMLPGLNAPKTAAPVAAIAQSAVNISHDEKRAKLNAAYRSMLKHGRDLSRPEQRDLDTLSDAAGTALVPQLYEADYVSALKCYGPIATLVKDIPQETGAPRKIPVVDDTAVTMNYLPDTGAIAPAESDPGMSSRIPGVDTLVSVVRYSTQEFDDAWDLGSFIQEIAAPRVARAVEGVLTTGRDNGTNTSMPNNPGLLTGISTGATTAALSGGIGYDDLINLASSVDQAYFASPNSCFMAHSTVWAYLAAQKDSTSRPYYNFDPETGLLQIAGKPLYVNNAMPAITGTPTSPVFPASTNLVLFGDFSRALAYLHTDVSIHVLRERYADQLERAAVITHRIGSAALVSGAVKALVSAAN